MVERLRTISITGTDLQSPIAVTSELTESEPFNNTQEAESVYKRRKFVELMKQGLALPGGAIAGIGLRLIADINEDHFQKPEFFLGLILLGVGAKMVTKAIDAVDKYDNAKIYLDKVKNWRGAFKVKKEEIVFGEIEPLSKFKPFEEETIQLTLDGELDKFHHHANIQEQMKRQGLLKKITTDRPVQRLRQAMEEQKASALEANEKTNKPTIVPELAKRKRVRARAKPSSTEKSPKAKTPRRASRVSVPEVEKVPQKNTDDKIDIRRHVRIRIDMIEKEDEELEAFGHISYHKCSENKCFVCRNSNSIII